MGACNYASIWLHVKTKKSAADILYFLPKHPGVLGHCQLDQEDSISMPSRTVVALVFLFIGLSGCTWVKLTTGGEQVAVASRADPACKKLGATTSIGVSEVASVDRNEAKVATELETLARNQAAGMGGNTIVPDGPVTKEGQQTFSVYQCP
jgi:hypothetical protein